MDLFRRVSPPLAGALIAAGLWAALPWALPKTVMPPTTPTTPTTPLARATGPTQLDPLTALRQDELAWRRVITAALTSSATPSMPTGTDPSFLATVDGVVWVVGKGGAVWRVDAERSTTTITGGAAPRVRRVSSLPPEASASPRLAAQGGATGVDVIATAAELTLVASRLDRRAIVSRPGQTEEQPGRGVFTKEGALFTADIVDAGDDTGAVVVVGGLEDVPLDRSQGAFFNIDSTLDVWQWRGAPRRLEQVQRVNLSAIGVVTPKAIAVRRGADGAVVVVAGAGSGTVAIFDVDAGSDTPLQLRQVVEGVFGANDVVFVDDDHLAIASPIADSVVIVDIDADTRDVVAIDDDAFADASALARLGEALIFTTALAPEQSSDGPHSRFSCEACHADGGVDGRVHDTGRFDDAGHAVVASTKPLWGLFQNPPLFSRAFDESVSAMVHAEVGVANALSPRGPWTDLFIPIDAPLLRDIVDVDEIPDRVSPVVLRRAMLDAFANTLLFPSRAKAPPAPAPTDAQWEVFAQRCMACHQPRLWSDDDTSLMSGDALLGARWSGVLTWASDVHVEVGVRPAVRAGGARVSSLRAVRHKRPLLTNGSAADLETLLSTMRIDDADEHMVWHASAPSSSRPLSTDERSALLAVLQAL